MADKSPVNQLGRRSVPLVRQRMTVADGFASAEEALAFGNRACGAACLKMVFAAFGVPEAASVRELAQEGIDGGHLRPGIGWVHAGLVDMARRRGVGARTIDATSAPSVIETALADGELVVASVSPGFDSRRRGGHLVVVFAMDMRGPHPVRVLFRDPSLWGQSHDSVDAQTFFLSWSGRIMIFGPPSP